MTLNLAQYTFGTIIDVGQVYHLNRYACKAGVQFVQEHVSVCRDIESSVQACMATSSKQRTSDDLPGPAPRMQAPRAGDAPRAPQTAIPEPANEPVPVPSPAAAPVPAGAALAVASALAIDPDEVVVIDPAAVTLSRRESQKLRLSGDIPEFDIYSTSKVK